MSKEHERLLSTEATLEVTMDALEAAQTKMDRDGKNFHALVDKHEETLFSHRTLSKKHVELEMNYGHLSEELEREKMCRTELLQREYENKEACQLIEITLPTAAPIATTADAACETDVSSKDIEDAMCRALRMSDQHREKAEQLASALAKVESERDALQIEVATLHQSTVRANEKAETSKNHGERVERWYEESLVSERGEMERKLSVERQKHAIMMQQNEKTTTQLKNDNVALMEKLTALCACLEAKVMKEKNYKLEKAKETKATKDRKEKERAHVMPWNEKREMLESLRIAHEQVEKERRKRE